MDADDADSPGAARMPFPGETDLAYGAEFAAGESDAFRFALHHRGDPGAIRAELTACEDRLRSMTRRGDPLFALATPRWHLDGYVTGLRKALTIADRRAARAGRSPA